MVDTLLIGFSESQNNSIDIYNIQKENLIKSIPVFQFVNINNYGGLVFTNKGYFVLFKENDRSFKLEIGEWELFRIGYGIGFGDYCFLGINDGKIYKMPLLDKYFRYQYEIFFIDDQHLTLFEVEEEI